MATSGTRIIFSYLNFLEIRPSQNYGTSIHILSMLLFLSSGILDQEQLVYPSGSNKKLQNAMVES